MDCKYRCKNWANDYGFCRISSCKPKPTGNAKTCPYFERREAKLSSMERTVKNWNKRLVWLAVIWCIILIAFCFMGCRTKSEVELIEVHDTTFSVTRDTATKIKTVYASSSDSTDRYHFRDRTEKIWLTRDRTVTLNEQGDTTRTDTHSATVVFRHDRDSVGVFKQKCDSLQAVVDEYRSKVDSLRAAMMKKQSEKVVRGSTWWERIDRVWTIIASLAFGVIAWLFLCRLKKAVKK